MGQLRVVHMDDEKRVGEMRAFFEDDNPGLRLTRVDVDGPCELRSEHGGMRVFWIYRGQGEVFLPQGYRTQEGDGQGLPAEYQPDPLDPAFAGMLQRLQAGRSSVSPAAGVAVDAILRRWKGDAFAGDYVGELWKLDHVARPWAADAGVEAGLTSLFQRYRQDGYSTKRVDSFEPVLEGDQLIVSGDEALRVRGRFACLTMENVTRRTSHVSAARRLRFLADTAGGCNPDFDPFRRLPLTWFYNYTGETDDGLNWVNSHVVNIPRETSPSHFHPPKGIGAAGGIPQREMYLTLDPQAYQLSTWGRTASLIVFPDLRDLSRYEQHPLQPGMFIYIPPGTGHRGLDVFVNVLTIPGFKPHNEYYLDRDIRDATGGRTPYNENLLNAKNYEHIEDLL
ncbi:MAG TPA: hypothetical protein PLF81_12935 [Candidatus Anammoximicrobium sp.]|nr:hypothetical protein [Candidatus Anammoximicrobium sp.]